MRLSRQTVAAEDLAPVDEFHVGGRPATIELVGHLGATTQAELLDIGCGIGGTVRFIASTTGARVTGIDLTPEYIDVAQTLSEWTELDHLVGFEVASALDMPFDDESFDGATQLHVGMNIADKAALFAEIHRVLRPGAPFALYDIMRVSAGDVTFPVPWAADASSSFVADVAELPPGLCRPQDSKCSPNVIGQRSPLSSSQRCASGPHGLKVRRRSAST